MPERKRAIEAFLLIIVVVNTVMLFSATSPVVVTELLLESRPWAIQPSSYQNVTGPYSGRAEEFIVDASRYGYLVVTDNEVKIWAQNWLKEDQSRMENVQIENNYYLVTVKYVDHIISSPSWWYPWISLILTVAGIVILYSYKPRPALA